MRLDQLSLNQATADGTDTAGLFPACRAAGITQVGLWRHRYIDGSPTWTRRAADDHEIAITSLCRGGFFTGTRSRATADADNDRAVDEAAELGAKVLLLVCGPLVDGDRAAVDADIARGIERIIPAARQAGITLGIEPFHPMFLTERSAIVTLRQARQLLDRFDDPTVGVVWDVYHLWWDPDLVEDTRTVADRIVLVQLADWLVPTTSLLQGRGLPGDGVIPLRQLLSDLSRLGYVGAIEVEVLNPAIGTRPARQLLADVHARIAALCDTPETPVGGDSVGGLR